MLNCSWWNTGGWTDREVRMIHILLMIIMIIPQDNNSLQTQKEPVERVCKKLHPYLYKFRLCLSIIFYVPIKKVTPVTTPVASSVHYQTTTSKRHTQQVQYTHQIMTLKRRIQLVRYVRTDYVGMCLWLFGVDL
jgi:hypothetical protein